MRPRTPRTLALSLAAALFASGCGGPSEADVAPPSGPDSGAGPGQDAGLTDAGPADAGPQDAGPDDSGPADAGPQDAGPDDSGPADAGPQDAGPDDSDPADAGPQDAGPDDSGPADAGPPPKVVVTRPHWRLTFKDDFRGRPSNSPDDVYCYDTLKPQCHVWPGQSHDCDLADVSGAGFFPPTRANLVAAIKLFQPSLDFASMTEAQVKALYGQIIGERLRHLNKCTWTLYEMVNWMATDYRGSWSARFDATQVYVDPTGKGYLELSATYAPVEYNCVYGGTLGGPNCQVYAFAPGVLKTGVSYWADPDPRWPGVYYAQVSGACPHGGVPFGPNCQVHAFPPHFLEETGVAYWVDADPRWPGVYYANQTYRCKDNIDYVPNLGFRNLTCPILNGGLMSYSMTNRLPPSGKKRGVMEKHGRFEVKLRVPKGIGSFPAAWLMPESGGWPYDGGEIDVMEARDNADEVYQTYHNGKCYDAATGARIAATDSADCARKGGTSTHLAKGFTTRERQVNEFWQRDHLFAVEWIGDRFDYFINNVRTGRIEVGSVGQLTPGAPATLAYFEESNFPFRAFYWILNHSTYVPPASQASFVKQTHRIDYVAHYALCGDAQSEYCPCGGLFQEGVGCVLAGVPLACPPGMVAPAVTGGVYPSACQDSQRPCVNGGTPAGARCLVHAFDEGVLHPGTHYWVDADPRWPGVFYAKVNGGCPYGGSGPVNCQLIAFPADVLETGVAYTVDKAASPPGVYYTPDFRQ